MPPNNQRRSLVAEVIYACIPSILPINPVPEHTSVLTGAMYYRELMDSDSGPRFLNACRMYKPTFIRLLHLLKEEGGLQSSKRMVAGEKIMIFIHTLVGFSLHQTGERWQHSMETISRVVHDVKNCLMRLKTVLFVPVVADPTSARILNDPKFSPFFNHCIGALDGSHVPAKLPLEKQALFRNRKGTLTQNVLAVVNFDMTFSYVLAGWEGSAHDGKVLADALHKGLATFPGRYYLGDAGYGLTRDCLTPYRGIRYHLKEWVRGARRPQNREELFNLRHSMLRNVVERTFGVAKKRFGVLS
jgi:hypothetical protein